MKIIETEKLKKLIADEGKQIREINDVYKEAYIDEKGNEIEEYLPYYTTLIYLPKSISNEEIEKMYIEE